MSDKTLSDFYSVKHASLTDLLSLERTALVFSELERRAKQEFENTFRIYQEIYGLSAVEHFSDDLAVVTTRNEQIGVAINSNCKSKLILGD